MKWPQIHIGVPGYSRIYEREAWSELQLATCTILVAIELDIHLPTVNLIVSDHTLIQQHS